MLPVQCCLARVQWPLKLCFYSISDEGNFGPLQVGGGLSSSGVDVMGKDFKCLFSTSAISVGYVIRLSSSGSVPTQRFWWHGLYFLLMSVGFLHNGDVPSVVAVAHAHNEGSSLMHP